MSFPSLLNEVLLPFRKQFGMYSQISWAVHAVDLATITVDIEVGREAVAAEVVVNVRNAMSAALGDLVPCPTMRAVYTCARLGIVREEHLVPFSGSGVGRKSSVILIEPHATRHREQWRERIEAAWRVTIASAAS